MSESIVRPLPLSLSRLSLVSGWLLLLVLGLLGNAPGQAADDYSRIVMIGDSMSDTGNLSRRSGGKIPASPPYFKGRFSNGKVWIEYLAGRLALPVTNRAYGSAQSGYGNLSGRYPGMRTQVDSYLRSRSGRADPRALYIVWGGANDFFGMTTSQSAERTIAAGVLNIVTMVSQLAVAGARQIIVINLPDLGRIPYAGYASSPAPATLTRYSRQFNSRLARDLAATGLKHTLIDSFAILRSVQANPGRHGFTDARRACLAGKCTQPENFLFFDDRHVTTRGHQVLAQLIMDASSVAPAKATAAAKVFQQPSASGQPITLEAEHHHQRVSAGRHSWAQNRDAQAAGAQSMQTTPNIGVLIRAGQKTRAPRLDYRIRFQRPGTYYVWIRGKAANGRDDSLHVGIDGSLPSTADRVTGFDRIWTWSRDTQDGPVARVRVAKAGVHTLNIWMREDGLSVDRLLLTLNSKYRPSGIGPAESVRK